jgi:tetratricopeptide (TPR) repeat protein
LLPTTELVAAEARLHLGQTERAQALLAASTAAVPDALANRPERIEALRVAALVARAQGARARAAQLLDSVQQMVDANGGSAHPSALGVALARSEMALEDRQFVLALSACERALAAARLWAIDKDRSSDIGRLLELRARIHAALGQVEKSGADRRAASAHAAATPGLR